MVSLVNSEETYRTGSEGRRRATARRTISSVIRWRFTSEINVRSNEAAEIPDAHEHAHRDDLLRRETLSEWNNDRSKERETYLLVPNHVIRTPRNTAGYGTVRREDDQTSRRCRLRTIN